MRNRIFPISAALSLLSALCFGEASAQNGPPFWSQNGNNNVTVNSVLGPTNARPVRIITNSQERMRVAADGDVGIGTSNPAARLEVRRNNGFLLAKFTNSAMAGDRTALIDIQNGNNVLWRYGVGGTGNGLGLNNGQFYIERSGSGASLIIDQNGDVGIGTPAPGPGMYRLKVTHDSRGFNIQNGNTYDDWEMWIGGAGNLNLLANGNLVGRFNHNTGNYNALSDERQKTNIKAMPAVLEKIAQLKPATYQYRNTPVKDGTAPDSYGFLAQELAKVFPHLVSHEAYPERGIDAYTVDYSGFGVIAIKAIQELQKPFQEQQEMIKKQGEKILELEKQVEALKVLAGNRSESNRKTVLSNAVLGEVTPNPVTATATISYSLPDGGGKAHLVVTDASGRTVKMVRLNGSGTVQLDASLLNNGVYQYSLVIDNKTIATRQMNKIR